MSKLNDIIWGLRNHPSVVRNYNTSFELQCTAKLNLIKSQKLKVKQLEMKTPYHDRKRRR